MSRSDLENEVRCWREARKERLAKEKEVALLASEENSLRKRIMGSMIEDGIEGIVIDGRLTRTVRKIKIVITNEEAFSNYLMETGVMELAHIRPNEGAIRMHQEEGNAVEGIEEQEFYTMSDVQL